MQSEYDWGTLEGTGLAVKKLIHSGQLMVYIAGKPSQETARDTMIMESLEDQRMQNRIKGFRDVEIYNCSISPWVNTMMPVVLQIADFLGGAVGLDAKLTAGKQQVRKQNGH